VNSLTSKRWSRFRLPLLPVLGLLLVPLTVAGLLTWSLASPENRLKDVKAAVVNDDEPVEMDGKPVPLGRQLSAKLVGGEIKSNYSWEFATRETAAQGLEDGTYVAVVTVPKNFSEAATSFSRDHGKTQRAKIDVTTSDRSHLADEAISRDVTSTAATLLGHQLTSTYLDNVYVGFNTLNGRLGDASRGATSLADGAKQLAGGTDKLSGGTAELAQGSRKLSEGLGALDDGAAQLSSGTSRLSSGLNQLRDTTAEMPQQSEMLAGVSAQEARGVQALAGGLDDHAQKMEELSKQCPPGLLKFCTDLAVESVKAKVISGGADKLTQASSGVSTGLGALAGKTPESGGGLPALAGGIDQLAGGASKLDDGAQQLSGGVSQAHGGATRLADGAGALASGAGGLADGARKVSDGTGQLSSGLGEAVRKLPTYPDADRLKLADTVASPIETSGNADGVGATGLPLHAVLVLWLGALATFLVLRAMPSRVLESTRSSFVLGLRQFGLPAAIAVGQGILVAAVIGWVQELPPGTWFGFGALTVLSALAFTSVNQALAAALRGAGRFASMLVALVLLVTGFFAAVPAAVGQLASALPVGPAQDAVRAVIGGGSLGGSVALLVVWGLVGFAVTCLAIERQRTVRAGSLMSAYGLRRSPEPA
jgi:putative membrane protein